MTKDPLFSDYLFFFNLLLSFSHHVNELLHPSLPDRCRGGCPAG